MPISVNSTELPPIKQPSTTILLSTRQNYIAPFSSLLSLEMADPNLDREIVAQTDQLMTELIDFPQDPQLQQSAAQDPQLQQAAAQDPYPNIKNCWTQDLKNRLQKTQSLQTPLIKPHRNNSNPAQYNSLRMKVLQTTRTWKTLRHPHPRKPRNLMKTC